MWRASITSARRNYYSGVIKRDYVYVSNLSSAQVVLDQAAGWFEHYNNQAPHKGLKMLSSKRVSTRLS